MKTIEKAHQIDEVLRWIDEKATKAINKGLKFTVEGRDDGITEAQFSSLHVWIRMCVNYLNDIDALRLSPVSGKLIPWTELAFKEDVYKVVLKLWKNKKSTKDQNTSEPNDIRLAISGHLATGYKKNIMLPEWPSNRD